ncbi:glutathione transferase GST 23-like protein [Cinnamomum micranthum f. kanehirae]|uniref:glutathione transferase n=1 Tax=Cinnamomum micranthum f. kanehirae TaxID=337451 RepID=A0A443N8I5_9MAGN|nr:glutathione transferase GST 23-like protein [Cinnamomum micranthum f. kanehirae]
MAGDGVKLLGMWASPFVLRIKLALKLKGIEYEYIEEDLVNKSERLLKYNPIHKKVPVLLHGDKPLIESLIILEYIDETWKENYPLLPEDPYERAMARFWAKYTDEKLWLSIVGAFSKTGEEQMKTLNEAQESLKPLEELLKGKRFFGGETICYLDIVIGWIAVLVPLFEELMGVTYVDPNTMPLLHAWSQEFTNVPLVKERLPPREKMVVFLTAFREGLISSSIKFP